jgi:methylthioribose-1-phosphate isomerase
MAKGKIDAVLAGADRITQNGDVTNKIGTYALAVLGNHHRIPLYVAAPTSTIDASLGTGDEVPIEERDGEEVRAPLGVQFAVQGTRVWNPAFDVTPAGLVSAIITERGVLRPPYHMRTEN